MAYASFRCLVEAPVATVWQTLRDKIQSVQRTGAFARLPKAAALREEVEIDALKSQITIRLISGQQLQGERRYALRANGRSSAAILDTVLNWKATSAELDQELMRAAVDILVRDFALEIKQQSEAG